MTGQCLQAIPNEDNFLLATVAISVVSGLLFMGGNPVYEQEQLVFGLQVLCVAHGGVAPPAYVLLKIIPLESFGDNVAKYNKLSSMRTFLP